MSEEKELVSKYIFNVESLERGNYWHMNSPRRSKISLFLNSALLIMAIFFSIKKNYILAGFNIFIIIFSLLLQKLSKSLFNNQLRKNPQYDKDVIHKFNESGFESITDNSTGKFEWNALLKTTITPDGILLYPQENLFYWIPNNSMESSKSSS